MANKVQDVDCSDLVRTKNEFGWEEEGRRIIGALQDPAGNSPALM